MSTKSFLHTPGDYSMQLLRRGDCRWLEKEFPGKDWVSRKECVLWRCLTWGDASAFSFFLIVPERCDDWGLDTMRQIQVFENEPARIKCPLFEHFLKYNYSTAHSAGLTLIWYWTRQDRDLEEPINFRLPENRIRKEKDVLWFRPTLLNDTGNYTCMLR